MSHMLIALTLLSSLWGKVTFATEALRQAMVVGNSADGTVTILDEKTLAVLATINVIPDLADRMKEINSDLMHKFFYDEIRKSSVLRHFEPGNGDRFVDDVWLSPDGTRIYVSRGGLGDIAAFDLTKAGFPLLWHADIDGYKADHAALSPDGTRFVVSATLKDQDIVFDTTTGKPVASFATGKIPHQNDYSADGKHIINSSVGILDQPNLPDFMKGPRQLTIADAKTYKVLKSFTFDQGIRPAVFTPDESTMFAQLSYLNGVIQFDLKTGKTVRTVELPLNDFAKTTYPNKEDLPHESVSHGLAMSGDGSKLCDAGTISNEVAILSTKDLKVEAVIAVGNLPYWSTTSSNGRFCYVSLSADNAISVIDYSTMKEVTRISVGKFPQRNRIGKLSQAAFDLLTGR